MNPTPEQLKDAFLEYDYRVYGEDKLSWLLGKCDDDDPLVLPRRGAVVSDEVLHYALEHARINGQRDLIARRLGIPVNTPTPPSVLQAELLTKPPHGNA